ncbi:MAG: quinolinate synthase NadA [Planctomycetes bacterium]|nr:quinolinate synthase NadA [Planctomycetota bacterium]
MKERLSGVVPDFEIHAKAELVFEINQLKAECGTIILGHNYMEPALYHTVPDVVGDSLELARKAAETDQGHRSGRDDPSRGQAIDRPHAGLVVTRAHAPGL